MRCAIRALIAFSLLASFSTGQSKVPERHFTFRYAFTVRSSAARRLRIWIPLAHSDRFQSVRIVSEKGDLPLRRTQEREYQDEMLYADTADVGDKEYGFEIVYDVVRRQSSSRTVLLRSAEQRRFLAADRLVPTTGLPAQLAARQIAAITGGDYDRARALYQYVLANMRYDKSGSGWGHGDTLYACNAKHGNCTDFHSLFISMARSQNIPARFEIGFPIPADRHSGEIPGYHCWADFYTQDHGWVPVDISEAWKHPDRREFFFGHWDDNRVQFSVGRDITLSPTQAGPPLNYFVYPYVEVDGKEYPNVSTRFSFEDVGASQKSQIAVLRK
jgi:transglutaminase-like putative cysteine protease